MIFNNNPSNHYVKSVRIWSFSGPYFPAIGLNTERSPYSVRMRENTDQKNSEYGLFSRSEYFINNVSQAILFKLLCIPTLLHNIQKHAILPGHCILVTGLNPGVYLKPCQTSMLEYFSENS